MTRVGGVGHLYAHLPFCSARCGYCAFVVHVGALGRRDAYLDALIAEIDREAADLAPLETVYLGGGTPTLMRPRRLARLMDRLGPLLAPGAEVSIECNPETVDRRALADLRAIGV
jgi:coproporphyrinogen III oxidase-like Fe-S oxidoreductase